MLGGQFDWGGLLQKSNGGVQRYTQRGWQSRLEHKGRSVLNCETYRSHSQAPLYLYTLRTIANRAEGAFGLLRYSLGGDRPSQTAHQALSHARIHGSRLGD